MTDLGSTPENRRYPDPFHPMQQAIAPDVGGGGSGEVCPPVAPDISTAGTPAPLRPERAAANDRRYGNGSSEDAVPTIPDPIG